MIFDNLYLIWFFSYCLPALLCIFQLKIFEKKIFRISLAHLLLLISILLSSYFIVNLNLGFNFFEINVYFYIFLISIVASYLLIKKLALVYTISSIIQELSMLLIALILFGKIPIILILLMIVPLYTIAHDSKENIFIIWALTFTWGILSILLFFYLENIWLNFLIHSLIGSILIKKEIIYKIKKANDKK